MASKSIFRRSGSDQIEMAQDIEIQSRQKGFWSKFVSENAKAYTGLEIAPFHTSGNMEPPQSILQTTKVLENGGLRARVTIFGRYSKMPQFGSKDPIQGTGEPRKMLFRDLEIYPTHKAFDVATYENKQVFKDGAMRNEVLQKQVKNAAADWAVEYLDAAYWWTLCTGFDPALTTDYTLSTGSVGAFTAFSPANAYVAGQGKVKYSGSTNRPQSTGYETNLIGMLTQMSNAQAGTTGKRFKQMVRNAQGHNVTLQQQKNGTPLRISVMNRAAFANLFDDDMVHADIRMAMERGKENPLFAGLEAIYAGCAIYCANGVFGVQTNAQGIPQTNSSSTLGTPAYGPATNWISDTGEAADGDTNDISMTWILGNGALHRAKARPSTEITEEIWDHGSKHEIALHLFSNVIRGDCFDVDNYYNNGANSFFQANGYTVFYGKDPFELAV